MNVLVTRIVPGLSEALRRLGTGNLAFALTLAVVLVLPDQIFSLLPNPSQAVYGPGRCLAVFTFCLVLSLVRSGRFVFALLLLLCIFEVMYFCYMAYFGGVIDANLIIQALLEYEDVLAGGRGVAGHLFYVPLIVIIPYLLAWIVVSRYCTARLTVPGTWIAIIVMALIIPYKIIRTGNAVPYYANKTFPSIANSYLNVSALAFNHLPKLLFGPASTQLRQDAAPIGVSSDHDPGDMTIVIIMSESLTFDHMSLYGYGRTTTPRMAEYAADPQFAYARGIASGIGTISTFYSFWNGIRDPRNEREYMEQPANLFRLARTHGFATTFLSAQTSYLLRGIGTSFIDNLVTHDMMESAFEDKKDEMILELFKNIHLHERNFIVLHLRSVHAPYEQNYSGHPELAMFRTEGVPFKNHQRNAYDNAVRYNDMIVSDLLDYLKGKVTDPLYVFFTSDHGQLLGDTPTRQFGHAILLPEVAHVPIMAYEQNGDPSVLEPVRRETYMTHYELTRLITRILGFTIHDPEDDKGEFFINGLGYYGQGGYIKIVKGGASGLRFEKIVR